MNTDYIFVQSSFAPLSKRVFSWLSLKLRDIRDLFRTDLVSIRRQHCVKYVTRSQVVEELTPQKAWCLLVEGRKWLLQRSVIVNYYFLSRSVSRGTRCFLQRNVSEFLCCSRHVITVTWLPVGLAFGEWIIRDPCIAQCGNLGPPKLSIGPPTQSAFKFTGSSGNRLENWGHERPGCWQLPRRQSKPRRSLILRSSVACF